MGLSKPANLSLQVNCEMNTEDDIAQWLFDKESTKNFLAASLFCHYLTAREASQIIRQFQSHWVRNGQVLWSGVHREMAQAWADGHHLQTLTTAMGPLMRAEHTSCLKTKKSRRQWSQYIHGASAIFAWFISRGEIVRVMSPPPPKRFHPSGLTSYQEIEEPIIKGQLGENAVHHIIMVHPMVKGGEQFFYELWPVDKSSTWVERFGLQTTRRKWRETRQCDSKSGLKALAALRDKPTDQSKLSVGCSESSNNRKVSSGIFEFCLLSFIFKAILIALYYAY